LLRPGARAADLYLELPARRLYPEVFSSVGKVSDEVKSAVRPLLAQGVAGLKELARFDPYIAGPELSLADFSCPPGREASVGARFEIRRRRDSHPAGLKLMRRHASEGSQGSLSGVRSP